MAYQVVLFERSLNIILSFNYTYYRILVDGYYYNIKSFITRGKGFYS